MILLCQNVFSTVTCSMHCVNITVSKIMFCKSTYEKYKVLRVKYEYFQICYFYQVNNYNFPLENTGIVHIGEGGNFCERMRNFVI